MRSNYPYALAVFGMALFTGLCGCTADESVIKIDPVGPQGTVKFVFHTDQPYVNGYTDSVIQQTLLSLPGLGQCIFKRSYREVRIQFEWESAESHVGFQLTPSELPGPADYSVVLTWDADRAISEGYFQGVPFGTEASDNYVPWQLGMAATSVELGEGPIRVSDVQVVPRYTSPDEIDRLVPKGLDGSGAAILWSPNPTVNGDVESRKGRLLYSSESATTMPFDNWIIEGPGDVSYEEGSSVVRSNISDPPDGSTGHFNFWCPQDFPENFIAEWDFKPISEYGLAGVFFAARGENGEDLFDPALPKRDGHYPQYHSEAIENYFLFFYTNRKVNRTTDYSTSWLLKAHNVSNLAKGPIGIEPRSYEFSRVRLVKDGGHILFSVNDRVTIDFSDPGSDRWGPVLVGGKIGFRQMARTVASYRNFNVWELQTQ